MSTLAVGAIVCLAGEEEAVEEPLVEEAQGMEVLEEMESLHDTAVLQGMEVLHCMAVLVDPEVRAVLERKEVVLLESQEVDRAVHDVGRILN